MRMQRLVLRGVENSSTWPILAVVFRSGVGVASASRLLLRARPAVAGPARQAIFRVNRLACRVLSGRALGVTLALLLVGAPRLQAAEPYRIAQPLQSWERPPAWECDQCILETGWHGEVSLGGGYQSEDAGRFGNLTGIADQGAVAQLDAHAGYRGEHSSYADLELRELGLDRYALKAEGGRYDGLRVALGYAELPYFYSRAGRTPYLIGDTRLRLPADWQPATTTAGMSRLTDSLHSFEQQSVRKRLDLGLRATPASPWRPRLEYTHEIKQATLTTSGAFLTRAANLPRPVDHTTDQLDLGVSYRQPQWLLDLAYYGSLFRNRLDSLSWDNPYLLQPETGQLAREPDNSYQQLRLSGLYLWERQQLHAQLAYGLGRSDADLLPYSTNDAFADRALPTARFEGEYRNLVADLGWLNRINARLTLRADYDYRRRDDRSPEFAFEPVSGDLLPTARPVVNRRTDLSRHKFKLEGDYRVSRDLKLSGGYRYRQDERDPLARQSTRDNTLFLDTRYRRWQAADLGLKLAYSERDGADPADAERLRLFYLADRRRLQARVTLGYLLSEALALDAGAQWGRNDYHNTEVGLTEGEDLGIDLSLSYRPSDVTEWHGFVNQQWYLSEQNGASTGSRVDWQASQRDRQLTLGLGGVRRDAFGLPLELGADYLLGYGKGTTRVEQGSSSDNGYPDLDTRLQRLQVWALHPLGDNQSLRLELLYERYREGDYAYSGLSPDSIDSVLTFGDLNQDYHAWFTSLGYQFRF